MKRRLEVLVGLLFASALLLGGCVAQTEDADTDEVIAVGQGQSALVLTPVASDPTRTSSGTNPSDSAIVKPGAPGMGEPEPQPWKPPPAPGTAPADPGMSDQQH